MDWRANPQRQRDGRGEMDRRKNRDRDAGDHPDRESSKFTVSILFSVNC